MADHSDQQLARALVHDINALVSGGPVGDREAGQIRECGHLAELLLAGTATDEERDSVYELVHPSTRSNFLS